MSSSITLSAATRQNLLSLQDTATLLSTTQNRLSTGKKVNSALDNPTNFFTSQSLTARSSDLSSLLDGMSNGIQTIQAANQGITSIQKLLDTAKSTASQALADKTGGSSGVTGGAKAQAAKVTGTSTLASLGTTNASGVTTFDLSNPAKDASLDISLDGGTTKTTIRIDSTTLASSGSDLTKVTSDQLLTAINGQIANNAALAGKVSAGTSADGRITFSTTATGAAAKLTVAGSANATVDIGYGKSTTTPTHSTVTAQGALGAATDFTTGSASLTVSDGSTSVQVKLDKNSATDNLGGTIGTSGTRAEVVDAINKQLKDNGSTATVALATDGSNKLVFSSADVGPDAQISVIGGIDTTGGNGASGIGFSTFTASTPTPGTLAANTQTATVGAYTAPTVVNGAGAAVSTTTSTVALGANVPIAGTGQKTTFSIQVGAGAVTNISIDATSLDTGGTALGANPTRAKIVEAINRQLDAAGVAVTASTTGGNLLQFSTDANSSANINLVTSATGFSDQLGLFSTPATAELATTIPTNLDLNGKSATFTVGGATVVLDATKTDASGLAIGNNPNQKAVLEAINKQLTGGNSAYINAANHLVFVGPTSSATPPAPTFTAVSDTVGLGFGTANKVTAAGTVSTPATSSAAKVTAAGTAVTFPVDLTTQSATFTVGDGTATANITINNASLDTAGAAIGNSATKVEIEQAIQRQLDAAGVDVTAAFNAGGRLELTSRGVGASASVTLTPATDTAGLSIGVAGAANPPLTANGLSAGVIDLSGGKTSTFAISDGTTSRNVSISATSLDKAGNQIGASATQAKVAEAIQVELDTAGVKAQVAFVANRLQVTGNAVGTGAAAPTLTATSDTAGLGLGTTSNANSTPAAGTGTAAGGVTSSGTEATDGSSKASLVGTEQTLTKDFSGTKDASFTLKLGSGPLKLITLNSANLGASAATSQTAIAKAINDQIATDTGLAGKVSASYVNNKLVISTTDSGSDQKLSVTAAQLTTGGTTGVDIGFGLSGSGATAQTAQGTDVGGSKGTSSVRSALASQFNQILQQISQQAQDSGYNGVNLLFRNSNSAADNTLHIAFNEKNTSALDIAGVRFDAAGLGLNSVDGGFQSDADINAAIDSITKATSQLRTQSSTFGANLSVVQNRQDFSKNLTNILDTGASNLTSADLNEEAANSQALSTRNSLAISALSLANQAQQGILQLLR
ncbi:flagellin [Methylobacterium sp. NEAU 140]|uniref:flagellin N-terminal helical domain-containing protein n=1 Tax=Methylobacterium sp. NEAU 140 TaxID=3064945 RepID=UPI0027374E2C|nr:flagellin [Methylobacterium sp. NEAU 140]MDP4021343.1 flagellin [Methylobacterium sp. NEAU 140]